MTQKDCAVEEWRMNDLTRLHQFLAVAPAKPNLDRLDAKCDKAQLILRLIEDGHGEAVVAKITALAESAPCERLTFALAVCTKLCSNAAIRQLAHPAVAVVCRTSPQLFHYVNFSKLLLEKTSCGWSQAQRATISRWYNQRSASDLAVEVTRYISRLGWSHADIITLGHVKPKNDATSLVLRYIRNGFNSAEEKYGSSKDEAVQGVMDYLVAVERLKLTYYNVDAALLIDTFNFSYEHVPTWLHRNRDVWRVLVPRMSLSEILKNLIKLASLKLLNPDIEGDVSSLLIEKLADDELLQRIPPLMLLNVQKRYREGDKKLSKKNRWSPHITLLNCLQEAFDRAFKLPNSTGRRHLVAVSGCSMKACSFVNKALTYVDVTAVAVMGTLRNESDVTVVTLTPDVTPVTLSPSATVDEVCTAIMKDSHDSPILLDCTSLLSWAIKKQKKFDVFVVYTDSNSRGTSSGDLLRKYRQKMNIPHAKLVVCSIPGHEVAAADTDDADDAGILKLASFHDATPSILRSFALDQLSGVD